MSLSCSMDLPVTTIPSTDRPRERLWALGPAALTTAELLAIVYPRVFNARIADQAGARGLDKDLVLSLIRQESGFHVKATSSSNDRSIAMPTATSGPTPRARKACANRFARRSRSW